MPRRNLKQADVETIIGEILQMLGVNSKSKRYVYLVKAIKIVYEIPETIYGYKKQVCGQIAKQCGTTTSAIIQGLYEEMRNINNVVKRRMTSIEFVAAIAEYIHIEDEPKALNNKISKILLRLEVYPNKKVFRYLKEAIQNAYENPENIYKFETKVCDPIAKKYGGNTKTVCRQINVECKEILRKIDIKSFRKYFGRMNYNSREQVLSTETIATIAEYLRLNYKPNELTTRISKLLIDLGILPAVKGFEYLRDAIEIVYEDSTAIFEMEHKIIRPLIEKYTATSCAIEKSMRTTITRAWSRGNPKTISHCFGNVVSKTRGVPTNAQFIAKTAEYLHLQNEDQEAEEDRISAILREIGIPPRRKGYMHLKEAIQMVYENPQTISTFSAILTKEYNLTNSITLISLRILTAIKVAWETITLEVFEKYFKTAGIDITKKPTNTEFVQAIVKYLHTEDEKNA